MATYLCSLVQLCYGEGGPLQTNTAGLCGKCLQWMDHTGFATAQGFVYFLGPSCSGSMQEHCPKWALHFVNSQVSVTQVVCAPQGHRRGWAMRFVPFPGPSLQETRCLVSTLSCGSCISCMSPVPAARFSGCAMRAQSQACPVSPLGSCSQAVTLLEDVSRPGSQEDTVSNQEPAQAWWKMWSLGQRLHQPIAFWLWL